MDENETRGIVVDCAMKIHMRLGPSLLERAYETVLFYDSGEALEGRYLRYHKWQTGMTTLFISVSP